MNENTQSAKASAVGRFPSPASLFPGCPGLFVQTTSSENALNAAASLVREERMGVVFTIDSTTKYRYKSLTRLTDLHRRVAGPVDHVLFDANRYSGQGRSIGRTRLDADWIRVQRDVGARVALTDSPYIDKGDELALGSTLDQAARFGDGVAAVLPLHLDWLVKNSTRLAGLINAAGVPVTLALEHKGDPLGVQAAVAGLTDVLADTIVPVGLLRSDLSVIGAVAFGAAFGAIGTYTSLRHIYPQTRRDEDQPKFFTQPKVGVFVPWSMGYRSREKIADVIASDHEHMERYVCHCRFCWGRSLDRIVDEASAFQHSLAAVAQLGEYTLGETVCARGL